MPSDAASVMSQSTTYSYTKDSKPAKRSTRQKFRDAMSSVGHPPTHKYDQQTGRKPVDPASMSFMPVYASRI